MNANKIIITLTVLLLAALACGGSTPPASKGDSSIGSIQWVSDSLEHNQVRVSGSEPVFQNDSLRLFAGGEGLLDLGELVLRLFNDTQLGGVSVDSGPGEPLSIRMYLERGGFTGKKAITGGQATFETPGGATIRVYGTTFFIVYDATNGQTTTGNFEGSLEFESGGSSLPVQPGSARYALPGEPPSPEQPITFSVEEFEQRAREQASPVAALDLFPPPVEVVTPLPIEVDVEPPVLGGVFINPEQIAIGSECPGADGMAQVTVTIIDTGGVARAVASWSIGNQSGSVPMERLDDQTFSARVGPAQEAGEMQVLIYAWDSAGNQAPAVPLIIPVQFCVG